MFNKKGYIGAIGDDLPSLIPIFLSITIFFSVFLNTFNVYRTTTDLYSLKNDALVISNIIKEEPLFIDYEAFIGTCNKVNTNYNWNIFVTPLDLNTENYKPITSLDLDIEGTDLFITHWSSILDEPFFCGNRELNELISALDKKNVVIYKYPATVQQKFYAEPVWLFVIVWK